MQSSTDYALFSNQLTKRRNTRVVAIASGAHAYMLADILSRQYMKKLVTPIRVQLGSGNKPCYEDQILF